MKVRQLIPPVAVAAVLLPAQAWGEKDGTVTNSERCISRQRRLVPARGLARPDWRIVADVAIAMGFSSAFAYQHPHEVFLEHAALTAFENDGERKLNLHHLTTLDRSAYETLEPTPWPSGDRPFADHTFSTPSRRAQFVPTPTGTGAAAAHDKEPFLLNSGRLRDQWHTMTRTGLVPRLTHHRDAPCVAMHPEDGAALGIEAGAVVEVSNARGTVTLLAEISDAQQPGQLFVPIHWTDQYARNSTIAQLYGPCTDPVSGQPASKTATVACRKVDVRWHVRLVSTDHEVPEAFRGAPFWCRTPWTDGWAFQAGVNDIDALVAALPGETPASYRAAGEVRAQGRIAGQVVWLLHAVVDHRRLPALESVLLRFREGGGNWEGLSLLAAQGRDTSRLVCTCYEVREDPIRQAIEAGAASVAELGTALRCGTNCGSCRPELNRLLVES